jgi:GNAT superfamily N-acetyltransferase
MIFRPIAARDRASYLALSQEFYQTDAVCHPLPADHAARTFDLLMTGTPYAACLMADFAGQPVGYALLALTWSQEAGGPVVWVEELYLRPAFQGQGAGTALLRLIRKNYPEAARFRLEVSAANARAAALYERDGFTPLPYRQLVLDRDG